MLAKPFLQSLHAISVPSGDQANDRHSTSRFVHGSFSPTPRTWSVDNILKSPSSVLFNWGSFDGVRISAATFFPSGDRRARWTYLGKGATLRSFLPSGSSRATCPARKARIMFGPLGTRLPVLGGSTAGGLSLCSSAAARMVRAVAPVTIKPNTSTTATTGLTLLIVMAFNTPSARAATSTETAPVAAACPAAKKVAARIVEETNE